jgi:hypothetical protein
MKAIYYLTGVLLVSYFVLQILFDIWIYRTTKNLDIVLEVWLHRHKKQFGELTTYQQRFQKYLCLLERVTITLAIFVFILHLIKLGVSHG